MFRNVVRASTLLVLALVFTSSVSAARPRDRTPPTTPTNLRITASGPTSVSLAWNASTDNSSNWWYCVQSSGAGCFRVNPPQTTFTHPKLWPGVTYTFSVVALDSSGNRSAPSNAVTFTTPPDTTPPTAPTISTTSVVPTRIGVTWTASTDNATQVNYTLLVDGTPQGANLIGFRGLTVPYLEPESTHTFKVIARDSFGNASESNVLTVTTPPATEANPPTAPGDFRLSSEATPPEAWLDWDPSTDDTDEPSEILYEVYVNGTRASVGIGHNEDIVYCEGPGPNRIIARAIDTSGNVSPFSNEIVFDC
jgi:chitodextrinase